MQDQVTAAKEAALSGPLAPPPHVEHVFDLRVAVATPCEIGETAAGQRRVIAITGGRVSGPRLSGTVLPGGADYQTIAPNGLTHLHARYVLETEAGERVYVENSGLRFGSADVLERIRRGEPVDPALVYFRTSPRFEVASPALAWLTTTLFVATGIRTPDEVWLSVYAV